MIIFADLEAYSSSYFLQHNSLKAYAIYGKSMDNSYELFDVDLGNWLLTLLKDIKESSTVWFHNGGKYDYNFLLPVIQKLITQQRINKNNFKYFAHNKKIYSITFTKRIKVKEEGKTVQKKITIKFKDSYSIWPLPLADLGKTVGFPKLDYEEYDILDIFETNEDFIKHNNGKSYEYLKRDVEILQQFALATNHIMPIEKYDLTIASTANNMASKKSRMANSRKFWLGEKTENGWEPDYTTWTKVKNAYNGGFTYVKPELQLKLLNNVKSYDVNSLYPAIMRNSKLPYGKPSYIEDEQGFTFKYYQVNITKATALSVPFIHNVRDSELIIGKQDAWEYEHEYPKTINNQIIYMNHHTLKLFERLYKGTWNKLFLFGFRQCYGMFDSYIDYWMKIKQENDKNPAIRQLAKLFLNSLYGKNGQGFEDVKTVIKPLEEIENTTRTAKQLSTTDSTGAKRLITVSGDLGYYEEKTGNARFISYIPIAEAITSLARIQLVEAIEANWDSFIYCDTDSIHISKEAKNIDIDALKLGAWKYEGNWDKAVYRRSKHYYHVNNNGGYELKGGGFNKKAFGPYNLTIEQYIIPEFTLANGKTDNILVPGGRLIYTKNYKFTMPKWWKEA